MPSEAIKNLHVPLPAKQYDRLRLHSARSKRPATAIAREAIDCWLDDQDKKRINAELDDYIRRMAGTKDDLDPELEAAGIECLLRIDE